MLKPLTVRTVFSASCLTAAMLLPGAGGGPAQAAGGEPKPAASGYQAYRDAQRGFSLEKPAGWTVRADEHTIVVQSPDKAQTVFAKLFEVGGDESAEAHLAKLPTLHAGLFPGAQIRNLTPSSSGRENEVMASFSFQSKAGPGAGRALCSIVRGKGMLYALAAPEKGFSAKQAGLVRVVKSLRFSVPKASAAAGGKASSTDAQVRAALKTMSFVTWADPREHGFTLQAPKGWKLEGGTIRGGPGIARQVYEATSPDENIDIVVNDPRVPVSFMAPSQLTEQTGMREGTANILHYMTAPEFNRWYLQQIVSQDLDDIQFVRDQSLPEVARRQKQYMQLMTGSMYQEIRVDAGLTEFTARSRESGKKLTGVVIANTQLMISNGVTGMAPAWFAMPSIIVCADASGSKKNQIKALAAYTRMQQTFQTDLNWQKRRTQELGAITRGTIESSKQRSAMLAEQAKAQNDAIMNSYWARDHASDERQRGFINYITDKTDVTDNAGFAAKVDSGSNNYYRNTRTGTVVGTNTETPPGIDFTPLTEY